jgi:hypothetical protein
MRTEFARLCFIPCVLSHLACGERELPPPQAPAREVPPVEPRVNAPAAEQTRLLLDANGERAKVSEVTAWSSSAAVTSTGSRWSTPLSFEDLQRPICLTPCLADFSPGLHRLIFVSDDGKRSGAADVQVGEQSQVLRIALGRNEPPKTSQAGALILTVLGASTMFVGSLLAASADSMSGSDQSELQERGFTLLGIGAGTMLVGLPWLLLSRGVHQNSTVTDFEYQLAPKAPEPIAAPEPPAQ